MHLNTKLFFWLLIRFIFLCKEYRVDVEQVIIHPTTHQSAFNKRYSDLLIVWIMAFKGIKAVQELLTASLSMVF